MRRVLDEVADGVWVATSRRDTTTSTVVVSNGSALLVDPAWDPDELAALAAEVRARGWDVVAGFATHAHHDHLLWHPGFGDVPRYASATTVSRAAAGHAALVDRLGAEFPADLAVLVGALTPLVDATVPFSSPVQVLMHDGHEPGHCALWLPDRRVLLAGDMLSDVELPLPFDPPDLPAYLAGLDTLAPYVHRATVLVPGHGRPTDRPGTRLDADRGYLDALLHGAEADDRRRANPGMAEVHEQVRALAAQLAG